MRTTTESSTGIVQNRTQVLVSEPSLAFLVLFCVLGLLISAYVMTQFPAEAFLAAWL
jgi:hypothetical protein